MVQAFPPTYPPQLAPAAMLIDDAASLRSGRAKALVRLIVTAGCATFVLLMPSLDAVISASGALASRIEAT